METDSQGLKQGNTREAFSGRSALLCLLLVTATFAVYSPALHNGFVNYDDPRYITQNPHIQSGLNWKTVEWAAGAYYESNWHPLTWISHAADLEVFQQNASGHHAVSIALHALNAVLLFLALLGATALEWESFVVAAMFAVHPANVESVAWAAERKNVLSMFFVLAALLMYNVYAKRPSVYRYLPLAVLFAMGLASKPQVITFPLLLLLWDIWPLQRWAPRAGSRTLLRLMLEKIPLLLLSAASAAITLQAQSRGGAVQTASVAGRAVAAFSPAIRVENALVAYARYLGMLLWPVRLAPMYPHPGNRIARGDVVASALVLLAIMFAVIWMRRHLYLPVGWLWFVGTLVPMIGVVQVGAQAMADRYVYLSCVGLFCGMVWGCSEVLSKSARGKQIGAALAAMVVAIFAVLANRQTGYWKNSEVLWKHTLQVTKNNFIAHDSLAEYLMPLGRFAEGCSHLQASVEIFPDDMPAQEGLAVCAQARGDSGEAIRRYEQVLRLAVEAKLRSVALANLGSIYREQGDIRSAREDYDLALQLDPDLPLALVGRGLIAQKGWDYGRAAELYQHAMRVEPTSVGYLLLAKTLEQAGRTSEAAGALQKARQLSDDLAADQKTADHLLRQ